VDVERSALIILPASPDVADAGRGLTGTNGGNVNSSLVVRHLVMHGLVQGVFYRDSMRQEANRLGVTGWVRNRPNGTVEAMVQGTAESVDAMVAWANRGPVHARVTRVDVGTGSGSFQRFDVVA